MIQLLSRMRLVNPCRVSREIELKHDMENQQKKDGESGRVMASEQEPLYRTQRIELEDYFSTVLDNFFRRIFRMARATSKA